MIRIEEKTDDSLSVIMSIHFTRDGLVEFHDAWGDTKSMDGEVEWLKLDEFLKQKGWIREV